MQERVGCPGWLRGSRFKAVERPGRFLLLYDADTIEAFDNAAYYARLQAPTALSRAIFPKFRSTSRTACTVERRQGGGIAAAVLALRPAVDEPLPFDILAALKPVRLDLLQGHESVGQAHTTEKDLRQVADRRIERALLAFFPSIDDAERARAVHAPSAEIFALRHSLSKSDLGRWPAGDAS